MFDDSIAEKDSIFSISVSELEANIVFFDKKTAGQACCLNGVPIKGKLLNVKMKGGEDNPEEQNCSSEKENC